ncbi:MAG: UDP-glucuronic acid decarboxylase family protein [Alphaproteobacteria bacterium]
MKKILVTGGAGFLGSHLCEKLINLDNYVMCLDNLYTGKKENLYSIKDNKNFKFINADVINKIDIKVDEIYNLACPASPIHYQSDPVKTITTNVQGSLNVLELANKYNAKIFQASTSEVYGDPEQHPQQETYWGRVNPIGIRSCYDEGKRCAETLFFDFHRQFKLNIRVMRIFNTYGPRLNKNDGRVISNFIIQAINDEDITIYGDGLQTRSFCFVDDLIDAMIIFMKNKKIVGPVNAGNPKEYSMIEVANLIIKLTKSNSKLLFKKLPLDDPQKRKPDITLIKNLNWEPKTSLIEGLKKTINYFIKEEK